MTDQQLAADAKSNGYCLDVLLFFGDFEAWNDEAGGFVTYIAVDDPNAVSLGFYLIKQLVFLDFESSATPELCRRSVSRARHSELHEIRQSPVQFPVLLCLELFILRCCF
jgi:hypothetical protein